MPSMKDFEELMQNTFTEKEYEKIRLGAEFGAKLLKARLDRNLTQGELAEMAGLKQSAIARIENNGSLPRIDTIMKILDSLNLDFDFVPREKDIALRKEDEMNEKLDAIFDHIKKLNNEIMSLKNIIKKQNKQPIVVQYVAPKNNHSISVQDFNSLLYGSNKPSNTLYKRSTPDIKLYID